MDEIIRHRQAWACKALDTHERLYKTTVGSRLRGFWEVGEGWEHERARLKAKVPGFETKAWTLKVAPPSWEALSEISLDDGVVGPKGDWENAGDFLPLFAANSDSGDGFIVATVAEPHAVGFFHEESWEHNGDGYRHGVFMLAEDLDAFLGELSAPKKASDDDEDDDDGLWEMAGEADDEEDEDEDDEDEDEDDED